MSRGRPFITLVLGLVAGFATAGIAQRLGAPPLAGTTLSTIVLVGAYLAGVRWIERDTPPEFSRLRTSVQALGGAGLGIALFAAVMVTLWLAGVYHFQAWGSVAGLGEGALVALMTATAEEILFRGLLYRALSQTVGTWLALASTAALFGAAHAFNPGASVVSSLAIGLEAGLLLGAAYAWTKRLWLPIGLHAGWNFAEASLFGVTESGKAQAPGAIVGQLHGPAVLTGGGFGPEASIVAVLVCLIPTAYFLWRAHGKGVIEAPVWNRPTSTSRGTGDAAA